MLFSAKNSVLQLDSGSMDYVCFGSGSKTLVMLPGLGDGLRTVRGTALPMAWMYRCFLKDYRVYLFSRRSPLPTGFTTLDMARDLRLALEQLGIGKADILGVSMGGMIAQHFAIEYPNLVEKLVLVVTSPRPNPLLRESVEGWMTIAREGDHTALMDSNVKKIYSDRYYRQSKWLIPIMGRLTKPKSYHRFLVQAQACLTHDAFDRLPQLGCPTLVIGGEQDRCLGGQASRELAGRIPNARLHMYPQWGHGLYEEAKDFNRLVLDFLNHY